MKIQVNDTPILIGENVAIDLGVAADGPVFTVTDAAKGKVFQFRFNADEAKAVGVGLVSGAAVFEFQQAMQKAPTNILDTLNGSRRGRH